MTEKKLVKKPKVISLNIEEDSKRFEVDVTDPVRVDFKLSFLVEEGFELLLDLQGDSEVKLGKATKGGRVTGGASRYAVLCFDGSVFCLKSVCRYG